MLMAGAESRGILQVKDELDRGETAILKGQRGLIRFNFALWEASLIMI
jgi:hypothetical protein